MKLSKTIVPAVVAAVALLAAAGSVRAEASKGHKTATKIPTSVKLVDINSATAEELSALPGIGDAYAQKIIAGRPYKAKSELVQKHVIPSAEYSKIKAQIVAHQ